MLLAAGIGPPRRRARPARSSPRRHHRAPRGAPVGRRTTAGQPVPRPRLLQRADPPGRAAPAGHLGAARPAVPGVRERPGGASSCMALPEPHPMKAPGGLELMPHQARLVAAAKAGHRTFLLADEPGPRQDGAGAAGRRGRERLPAAGRRPERGQDQLGPRGRAVDAAAPGDRDPRRRRHHRRVRRHRRRQLRGAGPARRLARRPRLPGHGRRRGALHQEQDLPALAARAAALRADPDPGRAAAADGADRHPADQRHRGLPRDLAVPRLDRRQEAARRADGGPGGDRPDAGSTRASTPPPARA